MSAMPPPNRSHDLVSIQCLRGIAAMMVVMFHCFPQLQRMGYQGSDNHWLSSGVDIFFIISGFIMLFSAWRSPQRNGGEFLLNRAIRILPIYWLLTSVMVIFALFLPQLLMSTRFDLGHVIKSYLMIPALHPSAHLYWPILIPGWTLNCEAFFYLIFAAGLFFFRGRTTALMLFVGSILAALVATPLVYPVTGIGIFYTNSVMVEFVFGLIAAKLYMAGHRLPRVAGLACLISGFALFVATDFIPLPDIRGIFYGIPALLVFTGTAFTSWPSTGAVMRGLRLLGDASYSIYLTHMMTMSAVGQAWRKLLGGGMPGNTILFIIVASTICAIGGIIFYYVVEDPLTRLLKNATERKQRAEAQLQPT